MVYTGQHHKTTQTIYKQKAEREEDTLAELFDLIYVFERLYKFLVGGEQCDDYYYDDTNN